MTADNALHQKEVIMRYTILIATLSAVVASVLTTVVIGGSLFGADTASSANTPGEAEAALSPGGLEGLLQGDADCDSDVGTRDSQGILRYVLEQPALSQDEPCPDIATLIPTGPGPQGPQGEQGPAGPQGEQGLPGLSGLTIHQVSSAEDTVDEKTVNVTCPPGKTVISGGHTAQSGVDIQASDPLFGLDGWRVSGSKQNSGTLWQLTGYALCANVAE